MGRSHRHRPRGGFQVEAGVGADTLGAPLAVTVNERIDYFGQTVNVASRLGALAGAGEVAERVRNALVAAYRPRDCFVSLATGVLGTHVGPGAWAVFYQVEDGTPARLEGGEGA